MTESGVNLLRNAIIEQAAKDYKRIVKRKKRHAKYGYYDEVELDSFFHSQWFELLTDVDGPRLQREIRRRYK